MDFQRYSDPVVRLGSDAQRLANDPAFQEAVNRVLNRYAGLEENVLTSTDDKEIREMTQRIKHYAMLRKAAIDIANELDTLYTEGNNAIYDAENQ